ncbi:MAG TPA: cereblon family protein [Bacillota bacterium]|nr:cereblon family protein [Bacillota bacterium]
MDWDPSTGTDTGLVLPAIAEPEFEDLSAIETGDAQNDWLCFWCHNRVASEKDRFGFDGKDEFAFSNPEGIPFEIITFSQTLGCVQRGTPTLAHTWFPGHAWSYCQCDRCGLHLGWYYAGEHDFVGLIKNRLARALYLRN